MASKSLTFDIFGRDKTASKTMDTIGNNAKRMGDGFAKVGRAIGVGLAVAAAATIAFGIDSVKAYAEAEKSQAKLADAFTRFPKLADTNIKALGKLNTELAKKTRFDDDATAAGQAILAQYELTGAQLEILTPLMQDYAAKTGKDLPTAATDLGKAMLGNGKALKDIGVDFVDTGTLAGNFESIVGSLSEKVGGFAANEGTTAAGKLEILKNKFGELQEKVGGVLMDSLGNLALALGDDLLGAMDGIALWIEGDGKTALENFAAWFKGDGINAIKGAYDWVVKYKDELILGAAAIGTLTGAQWLLNAAMAANPIGLVILGLGALIVVATAVATNFGGVSDRIANFMGTIVSFGAGIILPVARVIQGMVNSVITGINNMLGPLNSVLALVGIGPIHLGKLSFVEQMEAGAAAWQRIANNPNPISNPSGLTPVGDGGRKGGRPGNKGLAMGAVVRATPGGGMFNIGEGTYDEAVLPLSPYVLGQLSGGGSGGGTVVNVHVNGTYAGDRHTLAKTIVSAITDAQKSGAVPRGALA